MQRVEFKGTFKPFTHLKELAKERLIKSLGKRTAAERKWIMHSRVN